MQIADLAVRLAGLHESPGYQALRFDDGPPLSGRVAVLPSAFNPPTRAHMALLELARNESDITTAAAMLSTNNVDKSLFGAPLSHRVAMLLALAGERDRLSVIATNAARLIDQGLALELAFPGCEFDFVVGFDTLVRLFDPIYYEDPASTLARFFARHRVIATNRAEPTADTVRAYMAAPERAPYTGRVIVRELAHGHARLSSTLARGGDETALDPVVAAYIRAHGLYGDPG